MAITRLLLAFTLLLMLAPPIVHAQDRESFRSRGGGRDEGGERGGRGGGERGRGEWGGRGGGERGRGEWGGRGGGERGERGGEGRGGFGRGGRRDPTAFLQRLDANGDGIIDPSEIPERMRPFMDRIGERMGFDPTKPISLEELQRQSEQNNQSRDDDDSKPSDSTDKPQSEPLVPGFGVTIELPTVPGFDIAMTSGSGTSENRDRNDDRSRDEEDDNQSSRDSSSSESSPSLSPQQVDARYRRFAESMLQRYDTNGDGKLQKEEWSQMRGEPELADSDGDGIITLDELVSHAGAGSSGGSSSEGSSSSSSDSAPRSTSTGKRFLTPAERLPAGLPDWFVRNDQDGDGQIMMHEFTSEWSEAKAAEFARYDLNGDGIIVPSEALQGGQTSTASRDSSSSSSDSRSESRDSSSSRDGSSFGSRSSSAGRDSWRSESRDGSSRFGSGRDNSRSFGGNRRSR